MSEIKLSDEDIKRIAAEVVKILTPPAPKPHWYTEPMPPIKKREFWYKEPLPPSPQFPGWWQWPNTQSPFTIT